MTVAEDRNYVTMVRFLHWHIWRKKTSKAESDKAKKNVNTKWQYKNSTTRFSSWAM